MGISIIDVARAANVSHMTVSRVLSGNPHVLPENVEAVKSAIAELGYVPPLHKRGPKPNSRRRFRKTLRKFLLAIPSGPTADQNMFKIFLDSPFGRDVTAGMIETAKAHSIEVTLVPLETEHPGTGMDMRGADGVILILLGTGTPQTLLKGYNHEVPCVVLGHCESHEQFCDGVMSDNDLIGDLAVRQLIGHGSRFLATITDIPGERTTRQRVRAFSDSAGYHRLPRVQRIAPRIIDNPDGEVTFDSSPAALVDQLFELPDSPDGLFLPHEMVLGEIYEELRRRGVEPVKDSPQSGKSAVIITAGYHPWLRPVEPLPHLISLDGMAVGTRAIEQLLRRIERPDEPLTRVLIAPKMLE